MARRAGRHQAARQWLTACASAACLAASAPAAQPPPAQWIDPSPHHVRVVPVADGVQLEVLDWGGTGRPFVLLAGAGNSAHVFDDFAPRLTSLGHVFGITRRGFGGSSAAETGYSADRLGEDVVAVLDALDLARPVLVGHSLAGQELSYIASRHAARVGGLVYLDAGYRYALFRPGIKENVQDLRRRLDQLEAELDKPPRPPAELGPVITSVMGDSLEEVARDVRDLTTPPPIPGRPPAPTAADLKTMGDYRAWSGRVFGYALPEAEIRLSRSVGADGRLGSAPPASAASKALTRAVAQRFTSIDVPALAIYASPHGLGPWTDAPGIDRMAIDAFSRFDEDMTERQARWFERAVPHARVMRLRHASHFVFITHAEAVITALAAFLPTVR